MIQFRDLEFEPRGFGGVGATRTFDNNITISIQASRINYSTPKEDLTSSDQFSSFEVAVWGDDGEFITKNFTGDDDVIGWQSRDEINTLLKTIQNT